MTREEILLEVISNMEQKKWGRVEKRLTDDFTVNGILQEPIFKTEWIEVSRALRKGIPDLKLTLTHIVTMGDKLFATLEVSGTHTRKIPSPVSGTKSIRSTGKPIVLPTEVLEVSFEDDRISDFTVMPLESNKVIEDIFAMLIKN
jgi:hypothetical protein